MKRDLTLALLLLAGVCFSYGLGRSTAAPAPPEPCPNAVDDHDPPPEPECDPGRLNDELILARAVIEATEGMSYHVRLRMVQHINSLELIGGLGLTPPPPFLPDEDAQPPTPETFLAIARRLVEMHEGGGYPIPLGLECDLDELLHQLNDGGVKPFNHSRLRVLYHRLHHYPLAEQALDSSVQHLESLQRVAESVSDPVLDQELTAAEVAFEDASGALAEAAAALAFQELEHTIRIFHLQRLQVVAGVPAIDDGGSNGNGQGGY